MIFQNEIYSHLLVTFVYFLLVSVLRFKLDWGLFGLWIGALIGTFFLDIDHLIYWFIIHPEKEDSIEAKKVWGLRELGKVGVRETAKKLKELYSLGQKYHYSHTRLIFHSVVGQVVLLILAFYLLSSGGSVFGSAFVMSINLHLLKDEYFDYFRDKNYLSDYLFWQIREPKLREYLREYLLVVSLIFLIMTGLLIRGI